MLFNLCEASRALLQDQIPLFAGFRLRIDCGYQETVALQESCGHGAKQNIAPKTIEDSLVGDVRVLDNLSIVGGIFRNPAFQLDHQTWIFSKDLSNLFG